MTSTELSMGLPDEGRPSSRVLKPPGGGHTNIFGEAEVKANRPRPRYDQQNSSNLNVVMNTIEPKIAVGAQKTVDDVPKAESKPSQPQNNITDSNNGPKEANNQGSRARVPPGGFSSGGFW